MEGESPNLKIIATKLKLSVKATLAILTDLFFLSTSP